MVKMAQICRDMVPDFLLNGFSFSTIFQFLSFFCGADLQQFWLISIQVFYDLSPL